VINSESSPGAKYAASFKEQLFGVKCDVEVVADLASGQIASILAMPQYISSRPAFVISLDSLKLFERSIKDTKSRAPLLDHQLPGASDHQLNCSVGAATVIIVKPAEKPTRFSLSIGLFHRSGLLEELDISEIENAISRIELLEKRVLEKVAGKSAQ